MSPGRSQAKPLPPMKRLTKPIVSAMTAQCHNGDCRMARSEKTASATRISNQVISISPPQRHPAPALSQPRESVAVLREGGTAIYRPFRIRQLNDA